MRNAPTVPSRAREHEDDTNGQGAPIAARAPQQPEAGDSEDVRGSVGQQPVLLIEQQAGRAEHQVRTGVVCTIAP